MNLGDILDAKGRRETAAVPAAGVAAAPVVPAAPDTSGDYILPVPFSTLQRELMDPVVTAHYSDIFAFFDADEDETRAARSVQNMRKMQENLHLLAVHPYLLIEQYLPSSLLTREVPHYLGEGSGTFRVLGMLARAVSTLQINVAVVSRAGRTADLLDAFLFDKPVNFYRYSGTPLREPRPAKPHLSTFHLVPAQLRDLTAAVYAAFDFMIVVDETFDAAGSYATALRAQLRDPTVRKSLAPLVRLVPLDSIAHAAALGRDFADAIAAAITLKNSAGAVAPALQPLYDAALTPLAAWLADADGPWPLQRPAPLAHYGKEEVERSLMLDTGGSYPSAASVVAKAANGAADATAAAAAADAESAALTAAAAAPPLKRLRRDEAFAALPADAKLDFAVVEKFSEVVRVHAVQQAELEALRDSASHRETELEKVTVEMATVVGENARLQRRAEDAAKRLDNFRAKYDVLEEQRRDADSRWDALKASLADNEDGARAVDQAREIEELRERAQRLEERLAARAKDAEYVRSQYQTASAAAGEATAELGTVTAERDALREQAAGQAVRLRELAVSEQVAARDARIAELQSELEHFKATVKAMLESERVPPTRERARYTNRAQSVQALKRGEVRADSPAA